MILNSIRWRVQAWHGLILVLVLTGFGLTAYHVTRENQLRRIDQELDQSLMTLFRPQPMERQPGSGEHDLARPFPDPAEFSARLGETIRQSGAEEGAQSKGAYYVLWQSDGTMLAHSPNTPAGISFPADVVPQDWRPFGIPPGSNAPMEGTATARTMLANTNRQVGGAFFSTAGSPPMGPSVRTRGEYRELFHPVPFGGVVLAGRSLAPDISAMRRLALWLTVAGGAVLLLGLAGGWWVATKAIAPIDEISATALKISGDDLSRRISVANTDNELGRLAGVLNSAFARLEAAFAHQARFTADASHELRTPLSIILTQTQNALARERPAAEYRETIEACLRSVQRMRWLTESLLQLARLDAGQEPMKRARFDLAAVAHESVDLVAPLAAERHLDIRCDVPPLECVGDAARIGQVVTNLLTNAIHYNRERGEVRISGRADNDTVSLEVADTGEGIPADAIPHIFERFYRVDNSRSGSSGRTGLGLAIVKAILDAHSAVIEVSSKVGEGSKFTIKLPRN